tara:strand:+ start:13435 stop:15519 length:2085 start_codon:yes stop_codon:yes gene_type:complete
MNRSMQSVSSFAFLLAAMTVAFSTRAEGFLRFDIESANDTLGIDSLGYDLDNKLFEIDMATVTGEATGTTKRDAIRPMRTIESKDIEQLGAHSLRDVLRSQLNFTIAQDPVLGASMKMNGLGGRSVNILIDGVPLTGRLNDNIDLSHIALNNIERIEIIDGPMAVEFGTNSLAGTINIITKTDIAARIAIDATAQYESVGVQSQSISLMKNQNGKHHSLHFNRYYFDGWSPSDAPWDGFSDYLADSSRTQLWNPKLQNTLEYKAQYQIKDWLIKPRFRGIFEQIENKGSPRQPYGQFAFDDEYSTRRFIPAVEVKHYGEDGQTLELMASYQQYWRSREAFTTNLTNLEASPLNASDQDTTIMNTFQSRGSGHFFVKLPWNVKAGYDASYQTFSSHRMEGETQSMTNLALFAQANWEQENIRLQFGIRKAHNSMFNAPFLPSTNGLLKIGEHRLRIAYARGFRAPSLKELYFRFVDINHALYGNLNLTPETSDFGQFTWTWNHQKLELASQFFTNFVSNQIGLIDQLDGTFRYQNFAKFQAQGVKINGALQGKRLKLDAASSLISSQQQIDTDAEVLARNTALECSARFDWKAANALNIGTALRWVGPTQRIISSGEDAVEQLETDSYSWIDAHVQYTSPSQRWSITATAKNITDVTQILNTSSAAVHSSGSTLLSWGRSFNFRVNYRIESKKHE